MTSDPNTEPREPDDPAAYALARHIADHPVSTIQAAFRYLNAPLTIGLHADPAAPVVHPPATRADVLRYRIAEVLACADGWEFAPSAALRDMGPSMREHYDKLAAAVLEALQQPAGPDACSGCRYVPCGNCAAVEQPAEAPEAETRLCGDRLTEWTCSLPPGPHSDWKHRDSGGAWWDQMRVPPYSNRDRVQAEEPQS